MRNILVRGAVFLVFISMAFASAISDVRVTDIKGKSFVVSWVSDQLEEGSVVIPGVVEVKDKRVMSLLSIPDKRFKLHYVEVPVSNPNTNYSFQIKSGATTSGTYTVKTASYVGAVADGIDISGKVANTTFVDMGTYFTPENVQNVYYEMYIEKPNGTRSAVRAGIGGYLTEADFVSGWTAKSAPFLDITNSSIFSYDNNDVLVVTFINYSRGYIGGVNQIGSKRVSELRIPVNVSNADVTMFENPIPVIDNFDAATLLGWSTTQNVSLSLTTNAQYAKALEVNAFNAGADGYNGYFMYDFSTLFYDPAMYGGNNIKTNKAYDWGRYKYIKFSVKNVGTGAVDLKLDIKDNDNKDFAFNTAQDDEYVYNLKFLKNDGQWKDIYIPLSQVLLSKNNVGGDGVFNPLQKFDVFVGYNNIYSGVPMMGFAVSAGKAGGSAKLIIENIELVTTRNNPYTTANEVDTDSDGIPNDVEVANGLNPNLASDAKADPDADGIDNYNEILNGTNPFVADGLSSFPEIDNFEKGIANWGVDGSVTTSVANTTDTRVSWNYQKSMLVTGKATAYYVGGIQKDISAEVADWNSSYKTLNMLIKAQGNVGDKIVVRIDETDGDKWIFTQYVGDLNTWTYHGMLLDRFTLVAGSTGDGIKEFNTTTVIRFDFNSAKTTGNVSLYIDNINVSTSNESYDSDGDGIPNWYEVSNNLNVLVANLGDTDGDGWTDLAEYSARTNPTQWTPHFPLIDNFERVGYTWLADGISITRSVQAGFPTTSLQVTGIATDYFGGFVGAYIYNPLNTLPSVYKSLTMLINNKNGKVGDKLELQFQDKDGDAYAFTQVLITADWKWYTIVLDRLVKKNTVASGNSVLNLSDLTLVGYSFISATKNGVINIKLDEIALSTVPTSDDTDGDGLPNWWEIQYGLSANVANINPSGDLKDSDGDGLTDLEEYLKGLDPTKKVLFPVIDNFELVSGSPVAGNWSKTTGVGLYYEKTTDTTVSWNLAWSLYVETVASNNYYTGTMFKAISIPNGFWTNDYKSLKYVAKNYGFVGDKLVFTLTDSDGDEFSFSQTFGDYNVWTYNTLLLDRFLLTKTVGNGVKDFSSGVPKISINLISATPTGAVSFSIDNLNVSTVPTSDDTDGDGIPNWFEVSNNLNVLVVNTGDTDGDGWSDLLEYSARTNPTQWTPHYPLIDNFERVGYTWLADGISITRSVQAGFPTTSLLINGIATNYFGGFVGAYIYNPLNTLPSVYKSLTMLINNKNGKVGDKIELQFQDLDGDAYAFTQVLITADWKYYTIVLDRLVKKNSVVSGNSILNLSNLTLVGYSFISATKNGVINIKLDEISLSTVPTSDDTDGDGLPNWWEIQYGLSSNVSNINPSGDLKDSDGDNITDLDEYLRGTDPTKKNLFPEIDNFEDGIASWLVDAGSAMTKAVANTTDVSISWNYQNSLLLNGTATGNYYISGIQKNILTDVFDWTTDYKSLKMLINAQGMVGDKLVAKLVESDGDVWKFEQFVGDINKWTYLTMMLDRFTLVAGGTGNGIKEFNKTNFIRLELVSAKSTGNVKIYVDSINVAKTPTSDDTDGDGIPNWFELEKGIDPLVPNLGDIDGDGWTDLAEYSARTNPNQWTPRFPLIDNFERVGYTWLADGISATRSTEAAFPTTSLLVTGIATNYFGGFVGSYIYNPLNTMPSVYKSLTMLINNKNGKVGDKIEIQLQDNDGDAFSFTQVLITADWKWYTIVLDKLSKKNSIASGNGVLNLSDLTLVGYSFISATQNGVINMKIDEIALSTVPTSDDTDGDGLPNWWEIQYGLDPIVPNINPDQSLKDTDGDYITDLDEYLRGLDPTKKNLFPVIDNFEDGVVSWILDAGSVMTKAVANTTDVSVSWNYQNSILLNGTATGNYYVSGIQKDILVDVSEWTNDYKSLSMLINAQGNIGDKLVAKLVEFDGDVWIFEQRVGDLNKWTYLTLMLDRFTLVAGGAGNGIKEFNKTNFIRLELVSAKATGNVKIYVDSINVAKTPTSDDTDGDGIPNWFELEKGIDPLVPNLGDIDGDGWTDLAEYSVRTNPNQWTPRFPLIDNFERVGYTWLPVGVSVTRSTEAAFPTTSLLVTGLATNYFGGFVGSYIYNPLNTMPEVYKSLVMYINNKNGNVGDKIEIQLQDSDGDSYSFTQVLITTDWKWYTLVLDKFVKKNSIASGNGVLNLTELSLVGYSFISATTNGVINVKLDEIVLSTVPTSDDTDGDGLPSWWEELYDLDPSVANINPSGDIADTDADGSNDLQEYLAGTNPNQGYLRHVLYGWNSFSIVNGGGQKISAIVAYLESKLGVGSIADAAIWNRNDGKFIYMSDFDFTVNYGETYYIDSNVWKTITPSVTVTMPQSYSFITGWNLLGKPAGKAYKASELLAEINDRNADGVVNASDLPLRATEIKVYDTYYYNGWLQYKVDNTGTDFTVGATYRSYGFMIKLTEAVNWTPKKDI